MVLFCIDRLQELCILLSLRQTQCCRKDWKLKCFGINDLVLLANNVPLCKSLCPTSMNVGRFNLQ